MSLVAQSQRRLVWPVAIALTCAMLVALLLYLPTRTPPVGSSGSIAAPGVTQAAWEIQTFPAGAAGAGRFSKADKERFRAQRVRVATLVEDVYDAFFLTPATRQRVVAEHFSKPAAARVTKAKLGVPTGVSGVQIKRREARIGIYADGANRAAARVVVAGIATAKGRKARFRHAATLWLERTGGSWQVIAFDVTQGPR